MADVEGIGIGMPQSWVYYADGLHPSASGGRLWADFIIARLTELPRFNALQWVAPTITFNAASPSITLTTTDAMYLRTGVKDA